MLERLESRRLLSVSLIGQTVAVFGTLEADVITVDQTATHVVIIDNGAVHEIPLGSVNRILIAGFGGNDKLGVHADGVGEGNVTKHLAINGGPGDDELFGGDVYDWMYGHVGNDTLRGGRGNDALHGGLGADHLFGDEGHDLLDGGWGPDMISGGPGRDAASYARRLHKLSISLDGQANDGAIATDEHPAENDNVLLDVEDVFGGLNDDLIVGSALPNRLFGGPGNDSIRGGPGNDTLFGGLGRDSLFGEAGNDLLLGFDGLADTLDGGADTDSAASDGHDLLIDVENVLA